MMDEESMTEQDKREQSGLEQEPEQAKQPAPEGVSETVGEEPPVQSAGGNSRPPAWPLVLAVIALAGGAGRIVDGPALLGKGCSSHCFRVQGLS